MSKIQNPALKEAIQELARLREDNAPHSKIGEQLQHIERLKQLLKYKWHGKPVGVTFGICTVQKHEEKPLMWWNYEVHLGLLQIPVVRIQTDTAAFMISNHFGIGVYKLERGGWPDLQHFGISGMFKARTWGKTNFDQAGFQAREQARSAWQKENFPEEYAKVEALREAARKIRQKGGAPS